MATSHWVRVSGLALSAGALAACGISAARAATGSTSAGVAAASHAAVITPPASGVTAARAANRVEFGGAQNGSLSNLRMVCPAGLSGSSLRYELIAAGSLGSDVYVVTLDDYGLSGAEQEVTVVRNPSAGDPFVPASDGTLWQSDTRDAAFDGTVAHADVQLPESSAGEPEAALTLSLAGLCPSAYQELPVAQFGFELPLPGQIADAVATVSTAGAGTVTGINGKTARVAGTVGLSTPELSSDTACDAGDNRVAALTVFSTDPRQVEFASGPVAYEHVNGYWVGFTPSQVDCGTSWMLDEQLFDIAFASVSAIH